MKKSVWTENTELPSFKSLDKDIKTDVLIIGGGICGILCAHYLQQAGVDYVLAEGNKIAMGITKNTTAKITLQHGIIYSELMKSYGKEKAQMYMYANQKALAEYDKLCRNISCDYENKMAYTYSMTNCKKIEDEVSAINRLGLDAQFVKELELPFETAGAVALKNQAQFNPLMFIAEISKELNIYENTFVKEFTPEKVITNNGNIRAKKIIVTTHFPFLNKHGGYFLKLYQHRSYVSAFEGAKNMKGMYVDEDIRGMSFRNYRNLLLIGGGGHRTGKQSDAWRGIEKFAEAYYPKAVLKYQWAAQDCMSLDHIPYIGMYSKNTPNTFVATGFNKWGITSSMVSALILTDMVQEKTNNFAQVFSPQRNMIKPQLFLNSFEAVTNLLTPATKRCPHLGCALKWNKAEHTWDCPCHGSRFEKDGTLIDNPATGDINNML